MPFEVGDQVVLNQAMSEDVIIGLLEMFGNGGPYTITQVRSLYFYETPFGENDVQRILIQGYDNWLYPQIFRKLS